MASPKAAPSFSIPSREIVAIEHPMVIMNIDNGLKTFGTGNPLVQLFDTEGTESCVPLYLRPMDRTCAPILSYNNVTSNVLLKITVPKRTGRKRKRGSNEPYAPELLENVSQRDGPAGLQSHSRLDNPKDILRNLKDNTDKYQIEAVGLIDKTHRYRGLADFHYSTTHGKFMVKFREHMLSGKLDDLKGFELDPSRGIKQNVELIPPPTLTDKVAPVNWGYRQNPTIRMRTDKLTGEKTLVNYSYSEKLTTSYLSHDADLIPSGPPPLPQPEPMLQSLIDELLVLFKERPIWSRRAIMNCIPPNTPGIYILKLAIQYVGYIFRGGPFRDLIIRYGVDPRKDPKYRFYQAMVFKMVNKPPKVELSHNTPWNDTRSLYSKVRHLNPQDRRSHIFDGKSVSLDGKIWQICDITDPLLVSIVKDAPVRERFDLLADGWYCNGTYAKLRRVMRYKITAVRSGIELFDEDFQPTLGMPDIVEEKSRTEAPRPNLKFKNGEAVRENRRKRRTGVPPRWMAAIGNEAKINHASGGTKPKDISEVGPDAASDGTAMVSRAIPSDNDDNSPSDKGKDNIIGEQIYEDIEDDEDDEEDEEDEEDEDEDYESNLDLDDDDDKFSGDIGEPLRDADEWSVDD